MDTTRLATKTFTKTMSVGLRSVQGWAIPVSADLGYDSSDPYAVTVAFHLPDSPVVWIFGRELLVGGLTEATGDGDVHVFPGMDDDGSEVVTVELCSPHGDALVEFPVVDVASFLDRSHALVAAGGESAHLSVDAMITAIRTAENG